MRLKSDENLWHSIANLLRGRLSNQVLEGLMALSRWLAKSVLSILLAAGLRSTATRAASG